MAFLGAAAKIQVTTTSATASFRDITDQVHDFSGFDFEAILEDGHSIGDAWREQLYSGFRQINQITLSGPYDDDTSTGTRGIFGAASDVGAERVFKINLGTTNAYPKFDVLVQKYKVMPSRGALTRYELTVQPTGSFSIVTT